MHILYILHIITHNTYIHIHIYMYIYIYMYHTYMSYIARRVSKLHANVTARVSCEAPLRSFSSASPAQPPPPKTPPPPHLTPWRSALESRSQRARGPTRHSRGCRTTTTRRRIRPFGPLGMPFRWFGWSVGMPHRLRASAGQRPWREGPPGRTLLSRWGDYRVFKAKSGRRTEGVARR